MLAGGMLALSQHPIRRLHTILDAGWLRTIGKYSYGMYIYHVPIYLISDRFLLTPFGVAFPMPLRWAFPYMHF